MGQLQLNKHVLRKEFLEQAQRGIRTNKGLERGRETLPPDVQFERYRLWRGPPHHALSRCTPCILLLAGRRIIGLVPDDGLRALVLGQGGGDVIGPLLIACIPGCDSTAFPFRVLALHNLDLLFTAVDCCLALKTVHSLCPPAAILSLPPAPAPIAPPSPPPGILLETWCTFTSHFGATTSVLRFFFGKKSSWCPLDLQMSR